MLITDLKVKIGTKLTDIPEGEYEVVVEKIEKQIKYKRPTLVFTFKVVSGKYKEYIATGWINFNYEVFTHHTKLHQWYFATMGRSVDFDESEINIENFYGRVLLVKIENNPSGKTGNKFGNVTEIIRTVTLL